MFSFSSQLDPIIKCHTNFSVSVDPGLWEYVHVVGTSDAACENDKDYGTLTFNMKQKCGVCLRARVNACVRERQTHMLAKSPEVICEIRPGRHGPFAKLWYQIRRSVPRLLFLVFLVQIVSKSGQSCQS